MLLCYILVLYLLFCVTQSLAEPRETCEVDVVLASEDGSKEPFSLSPNFCGIQVMKHQSTLKNQQKHSSMLEFFLRFI